MGIATALGSTQPTKGRDRGRGDKPHETPKNRTEVPMSKSTLPLGKQLLEADKRRKRRLAALARDHIMKLREERDRLAYEWSEEYARRASSAKRSGAGLSTLRAEYVHRYDRLLEWEKTATF